jgi:propionyl-CoA carboxylase alpha chain
VQEATQQAILSAAVVMAAACAARERLIDNQLNTQSVRAGHDWVAVLNKKEYPVTADFDGAVWHLVQNGAEVDVITSWQPGDPVFEATIADKSVVIEVDVQSVGYLLSTQGANHIVQVYTPRAAALARHMIEKIPADLSKKLLCPMPGLVVSIDVAEGAKVEAGQPLAVVEAMKMQNILRAEKAAMVHKILVKAGDSLAVNEVIMEFS